MTSQIYQPILGIFVLCAIAMNSYAMPNESSCDEYAFLDPNFKSIVLNECVKEAEKGNVIARVNLALVAIEGDNKNLANYGIEELKELARKGNSEARYWLGMLYLRKGHTDEKAAFNEFEKVKGFFKFAAILQRAKLIRDGYGGIGPNSKEAVDILKTAKISLVASIYKNNLGEEPKRIFEKMSKSAKHNGFMYRVAGEMRMIIESQ